MSELEKRDKSSVEATVAENEPISQRLFDNSNKLGDCITLIQEKAKQIHETEEKIQMLIQEKQEQLESSKNLHVQLMAQVGAQMSLHKMLQQPARNQIDSQPIATARPSQPSTSSDKPTPSQTQQKPSTSTAMAVIPFPCGSILGTMTNKTETPKESKARRSRSRSSSRSRYSSRSRSSSCSSTVSQAYFNCEPKTEKTSQYEYTVNDDEVTFISEVIRNAHKRYGDAEKNIILHTMVYMCKMYHENFSTLELVVSTMPFWEKFKNMYQVKVKESNNLEVKDRTSTSLKGVWERMAEQIFKDGDNYFRALKHSVQEYPISKVDRKILTSLICHTIKTKEETSAKRKKLG